MPRKPNPMKRVIENLPFEPVTVSIKEWEGNIWVHSFQGTWGKNTKRISIPAEYFCETTKADELVELICGSSDASVIIKPKSSLGKLPISFSSKSDGNETVFALSLGGVPSSSFSSPLAEIIFSLEGAKEFVETFEWVQTAIRREFVSSSFEYGRYKKGKVPIQPVFYTLMRRLKNSVYWNFFLSRRSEKYIYKGSFLGRSDQKDRGSSSDVET